MSPAAIVPSTGSLRGWRRRCLACAVAIAQGAGCGAPAPPPRPTVRQTPEDAVLRIGSVWEARERDSGLRSSPSPISAFERHVLSRIELRKGASAAVETLLYEERFTMRAGGEVTCQTPLSRSVEVTYGRKLGKPAIELAWAAMKQPRRCGSSGPPVPPLELEAGRSRFMLRADRLEPIEPPLETRQFVPAD